MRIKRVTKAVSMATRLAGILLFQGACGSGVSQVHTSIGPQEFTYAAITSNSLAPTAIAGLLVSNGYTVVTGAAAEQLFDRPLPQRAFLSVSCTYLGHTGNDFTGTSATVSCDVIDLATRAPVYNGTGKHMGMSVDDDIRGALSRALKGMPKTGRPGGTAHFASIAMLRDSSRSRQTGRIDVTTGTAFYVDPKGHLLTNAHVVNGCGRILSGVNRKTLRLVRLDTTNDLAILASDGDVSSFARFREGRGPRAGDPIVAIGYPLSGILATEANVTTGTISALAGLRDDVRFLQISAPVQPGNSGGPLLDLSGNVIGIVTAKLNALRVARVTGDIPQNVNFAINATVARSLLDALGIDYVSASGVRPLETAMIAEAAKRYTVLIECVR